jgi:glycerol-3-phosphate dehydrogenase subunit B
LGTEPNYKIFEAIEREVGCRCIELTGMPPGVTGLRLRKLLLSLLKKRGARVIENAAVVKALSQNEACIGVITSNLDRERSYHANSFVLATGGMLGGGLITEPGEVKEAILSLPVLGSKDQELWGQANLFNGTGQPFARIGVATDATLRPVNDEGKRIYQNVYIAGRSLAGYDFCLEKSGNGVALVSGYQAGMSI